MFVQLVCHRQGEKLDVRLRQVTSTPLPDLRCFARCLEREQCGHAGKLISRLFVLCKGEDDQFMEQKRVVDAVF